MAIICRKYNLLFIMTPRTACTAIGELLCSHYDGEFLPGEDILDSDGCISIQKKHSTLGELIQHKLLSTEEAKSLLKVVAVRNPFDTLVSLYFKQRYKYQPLLADPNSWVNRSPAYARNMRYARTHSFDAWVLKKCAKQLAKRARGTPPSMFHDYTNGVDVVMRYETINEDLRKVLTKVGVLKDIPIPMTNRTDERPADDYRSFYSKHAKFLVSLAYSRDLQKYGYSF
jgi:hypothetical protein